MDHVYICQDVDGHGAGRLGVGGRVVSSVGSRGDEVGQREEEVQPWVSDRAFEVTRQSRYGLRGVRVSEASNPGPQSTRIDSDEELILPGRFSPWCHGDSAESVPIPGTPPGAANDSTVAEIDLKSGDEQDGFVSVSQRRSRRGGGHSATSTTVFPFQANRFAVFDAESMSQSDTVSVGSRHQEGPRQRRRLVLMSSGTVATAIDSPDSHEERFQRVRRAVQERPVEAVPVADQEGHSASEDHDSEASVRGHVDATEPLRTAALRAAFATLDSIILPDLLKKRPSVMRSVPHFLKGPFRNALQLALEEAVSEEFIGQERCWKLMLLLPRMLLHRPPRGGLIAKDKLHERFQSFCQR